MLTEGPIWVLFQVPANGLFLGWNNTSMVFYSELSCSLNNFLMNITTVMYYCQQIIFQWLFS